MKKIFLFLSIVIVIQLYSCTKESLDVVEAKECIYEKSLNGSIDSLNLNGIVPIEGDRDTLKRPIQVRSSYDDQNLYEELWQLNELPIYLKVRGNSTSKQFMNATYKGKELTIENYAGNTNQQFYIKILPASSGIPYLIYSKQTLTPIRLGAYSKTPDIKVLYASQDATGSLFGASWDIKRAEYTPQSFIIENQDFTQQGSSGSPWDIFYSVVTVDNSKISFSKYSKSPRQEFEIIPVESFKIEEIKFNLDASPVLTKLPDIILNDKYINNGPVDQSHKFTLTETVQESSNYNRKTSYNVNVSTEIKAKVPFIASGKINTSATFGQEYTYGKSETKTKTISREYPINIPARHKAEISLALFNYNMDVEYIAVCRGLTSGKVVNIKGRWNGVSVVETDARLDVTPIDGGITRSIVISKEMLNSKRLIEIK